MTRLKADILLMIAAVIWGTTFVAQKTGMDGLGPFGFVISRFALSIVVIAPLAFLEMRKKSHVASPGFWPIFILCLSFCIGVILQQVGQVHTSVTNAGFITGLYVVLTPLVAWMVYSKKPASAVWIAAALSIGGIWMINGGSLTSWNYGDFLILLSAVCYGFHLVFLGDVMKKTGKPFAYAVLQYALCLIVALPFAFLVEGISIDAINRNWFPILYAGILSGGIAYTLQPIAQQYTPPSDAAIILSSEALFAALAAAVILGERMNGYGWIGCAMIFSAILVVELAPLLGNRFRAIRPHG